MSTYQHSCQAGQEQVLQHTMHHGDLKVVAVEHVKTMPPGVIQELLMLDPSLPWHKRMLEGWGKGALL